MSHDMEMSCDECVLKEMGKGIKKDYSSLLLALAVERKIINGNPLAFGESNVKRRIKNVINHKKPAFWVVVVSVILVVVVGFGLMVNPENDKEDLSFLNINNTASVATQQEQLLVRVHSLGTSIISGSELGKFLETTSSNWSRKSAVAPSGSAPNLTVYINIGSNHNVRFYKSHPDLAVVEYDVG
jgi:hypothetical protein